MFDELQISTWTEGDHLRLLEEVETHFLAEPGEPEFERVRALSDLIYRYEEIHYPVPKPASQPRPPAAADKKPLQNIR